MGGGGSKGSVDPASIPGLQQRGYLSDLFTQLIAGGLTGYGPYPAFGSQTNPPPPNFPPNQPPGDGGGPIIPPPDGGGNPPPPNFPPPPPPGFPPDVNVPTGMTSPGGGGAIELGDAMQFSPMVGYPGGVQPFTGVAPQQVSWVDAAKQALPQTTPAQTAIGDKITPPGTPSTQGPQLPFGGLYQPQQGGFDLGGMLTRQLSLPSWQGPYGAGLNQAQGQALGQAAQTTGMLGAQAPGLAAQVTGGLQGIAGAQYAPAEVQALLQQVPQMGLQQYQQPVGGALQRLQQGQGEGVNFGPLFNFLNVPTPERSALQGIQPNVNAPGVQDAITRLQQFIPAQVNPNLGNAQSILEQLAQGGAGTNFASALSALDAARQAALSRDIANTREQFGSQGLRFSTDLARALGERQAESEANFMGEGARLMAQMAPQDLQARIAAATQLGQLGLGGAQLGLGGGSQLIQALQAAGQLGLGAGELGLGGTQQQIQALQQAGQLGLGGAQIGLGAAQGYTQGAGEDIARQLATAQFLSQQGLQAGGQLSGQNLQAAQLLGQLFGNQQGIATQALGQIPGAYGQLAQLPLGAASTLFGLGEAGRQVSDTDIQRRMAEMVRTQAALYPSALSFAGGGAIPQLQQGTTPKDTLGTALMSAGPIIAAVSSARFKWDVNDAPNSGASAKDLARLRPVTFKYKGTHVLQHGLIAEEVVKIVPEVVALDVDGEPMGVDYGRLTTMLVHRLQELTKERE